MAKRPAILLYKGDWLKDPLLGQCSPATRGIWMDLICHMDDHEGVLSGTTLGLSRICRCSESEMDLAVAELNRTKAADVTISDGITVLTCRRIARDFHERQGARRRQQKLRDKGGGLPSRWTAIRVRILERDSYICAYCGKKATVVDHITPRSQGGDESNGNLVGCCKSCNQQKGSKSMEKAGFTFWHGFDTTLLARDTSVTPPSSSSSSSSKETKKRPSDDGLDWDEITSRWNKLVGMNGLPRLRHMQDANRRDHYRARLKANDDFWDVVEREIPWVNENTREWISFPWIIKAPSNFTKLAEGNYRAKPGSGGNVQAPTGQANLEGRIVELRGGPGDGARGEVNKHVGDQITFYDQDKKIHTVHVDEAEVVDTDG